MNNGAGGWREEWDELPGEMRHFATRAGRADAPVLSLGPPGSGKGYLAELLHALSPRAGAPLLPHNCGVFTASLAEARLFGVVKGAYTGAAESRAGLVEAAEGGALFLDELGALPFAVRAMLLRFLETGEFSRLGSADARRADVRAIAATNRDLGAAIGEGSFRGDLVARLPLRYEVPPLRERRREIAGIARRHLRAKSGERGVAYELTGGAARRLRSHGWPGNVRELLSVLDYCALFADQGSIGLGLVGEAMANQRIGTEWSRNGSAAGPPKPTNGEEKRRALREGLAAAGGNRSEAARLLGIHRRTLYRWMARYDEWGP